ncbi:MAG: transporter substrate-binding domain-containing protein [Cellvibrionales bacterium]|nr:transporter substrate-binding domain-containing protein [Cellvibrionales bacterium]
MASHWQTIKNKKRIKVITLQPLYTPLPRAENKYDHERRAVLDFAKAHRLRVKWMRANSFQDATQKIATGEADILIGSGRGFIAREPQANANNDKHVALTLPLYLSNDYLVAHKRVNLAWLSGLSNKVVAIKDSPHQHYLASLLASQYPGMRQVVLPEPLEGDLLYRQLKNRFDFIILSGDNIRNDLQYRNDIQKYLPVSEDQSMVWAVNSQHTALLNQLNLFILAQQNNIKGKPIFRVGMLNAYSGLYLYQGEKKGFHAELVQQFFSKHQMPFEYVFADSADELTIWLQEGKIDMAAHYFTELDAKDFNILATEAFIELPSVLLVHNPDQNNLALSELDGRFLSIPWDFNDVESLAQLKEVQPSLKLLKIKQRLGYRELVDRVNHGIYDMTIVPGFVADRSNLSAGKKTSRLALNQIKSYRWLLSKKQADMLPLLSAFFESKAGPKVYQKYYHPSAMLKHSSNASMDEAVFLEKMQQGTYTPYDDLIRQLSKKHSVNWRLFIAAMYETSGFDSAFYRENNGIGLMQVSPFIAERLGFYELKLPENNIKAAAAYLGWIDQQLAVYEIATSQRPWFVLAAFRVGLSHVKDAIHLAHKMQLNPSVWFDQVEVAMRMLERPRFHRSSRYGYVDGDGVADYLRSIKKRYRRMKRTSLYFKQLFAQYSYCLSKKHEEVDTKGLFILRSTLFLSQKRKKRAKRLQVMSKNSPLRIMAKEDKAMGKLFIQKKSMLMGDDTSPKQHSLKQQHPLLKQLGIADILESVSVPND